MQMYLNYLIPLYKGPLAEFSSDWTNNYYYDRNHNQQRFMTKLKITLSIVSLQLFQLFKKLESLLALLHCGGQSDWLKCFYINYLFIFTSVKLPDVISVFIQQVLHFFFTAFQFIWNCPKYGCTFYVSCYLHLWMKTVRLSLKETNVSFTVRNLTWRIPYWGQKQLEKVLCKLIGWLLTSWLNF